MYVGAPPLLTLEIKVVCGYRILAFVLQKLCYKGAR